jgi:hypothetical protein
MPKFSTFEADKRSFGQNADRMKKTEAAPRGDVGTTLAAVPPGVPLPLALVVDWTIVILSADGGLDVRPVYHETPVEAVQRRAKTFHGILDFVYRDNVTKGTWRALAPIDEYLDYCDLEEWQERLRRAMDIVRRRTGAAELKALIAGRKAASGTTITRSSPA